jgi:CMP-N,N'-diacetyllegionaminic acid synthase
MKIVSLIMARGGSKRVPRKNVKYLGDYPLLAYSVIASKLCSKIDETYVSTDDLGIAYVGLFYGADVPYIRSKELASDTATDYDVMRDFLEKYYSFNQEYPTYIIHLRPTTPFRDINIISKAIESIKEGATSLRSVELIKEAPEKTFRIRDNYLVPTLGTLEDSNKPNQNFEASYTANGYVDILKTDTILNYKSIYGNKIQPFLTNNTIEIDTIDDFNYAEYYLKNNGCYLYEFLKGRDRFIMKDINKG